MDAQSAGSMPLAGAAAVPPPQQQLQQGGGGGGGGGGVVSQDMELVSRSLALENKVFYLDLKDNRQGRFLKISERNPSSQRSAIIVPLAGVVWFVDLFNYYANGGDDAEAGGGGGAAGELSSKELQLDTKVFYFDVGENARGRFLKVSEASMQRGRGRSSIIVPAGTSPTTGWGAFRDALVQIHEASLALPMPGPGTQPQSALPAGSFSASPPLPQHAGSAAPPAAAVAVPQQQQQQPQQQQQQQPQQAQQQQQQQQQVQQPLAAQQQQPQGPGGNLASRVIRAEQKRFFLDLGNNPRGHFLRISEVQGTNRSSVIVPVSALESLHEAIGQMVEMLRAEGGTSLLAGSVGHVRTIPPRPPPGGASAAGAGAAAGTGS